MQTPQLARLPLLALFACSTPHTAQAAPDYPPPAPVPVPEYGPPGPPGDLDITVDVDVGEPVMIAGQEQRAYLKITLGGFALPAQQRPPINLALVLDRSGSMAGDKLEKAKEAALMVVDRLQPDDVFALVTYDSVVELLVPATRGASRDAIREQITAIGPRGSTALYDGVAQGIREVSKHLSASRVNRMILLSDGQANIGPSTPNELGRLGEVAARQGIAVSTIGLGLGYNEDLMTQLALRSDGNHAFAENAVDLARIFTHEIGDVLSAVAQNVNIEIQFEPGIRPVRAIGRDAAIQGNKAHLAMSQLYAKQEKYVLFEVVVPPGTAGQKRGLADVSVSYANLVSKKSGQKRRAATVEFSAARDAVAKHQNKQVMEATAMAIGVDNNRRALALRDQGNAKDAEKVLQDNAVYLKRESTRLNSVTLENYSVKNSVDATNVQSGAKNWERSRKQMRESQAAQSNNRSW